MSDNAIQDNLRPKAPELLGRGWLNTGGVDLDLNALKGKIVILDFWTFCCVNCLHVLDELRPLEEKWANEVVVVGVHSPKFEFERDPEALAANMERYSVEHPVLDDPNLKTWVSYGAKAWPTLMVLDTHGRVAASLSGEGHQKNLDDMISRLVAEGEADGSLKRSPAPAVIEAKELQPMRFPSKAVQLHDGRFAVSDAGQHRIVILAPDGVTTDEIIGTGIRGFKDGEANQAQFNEPNGIAVLSPQAAEKFGYDLIIADTVNHCLRAVILGHRRLLRSRVESRVVTLAGNSKQWMHGYPLPIGQGNPLEYSLSTPWDLQWDEVSQEVIITMAGIHQMWSYSPATLNEDGEFIEQGALRVLAGTTQEGLVDGPLVTSWWAQPSGVSVDASGAIFVADSETSAIRVISPDRSHVKTIVGTGLFDFGHVDGELDAARLQHPLGITVMADGRLAVADTYNGAVRIIDPAKGTVVTVAQNLKEPSDVLVVEPIDDVPHLAVVESGRHKLTWISISPAAEEVVNAGALRTKRPVTEVSDEGSLKISVLFTPPKGHKLDESFGPATQVSISTTPAAMLLEGGGSSTELSRQLKLDPSYEEGVIHINARAASCDADPAIEFPACHMHQQDWGVPIRFTSGGSAEMILSLLG